MDEFQIYSSPELYKVSSSAKTEKAMSNTEAITDMAEAKDAIKQQLSTLVQDTSTKGGPLLMVYLLDLALDLAIEEEQKFGGHMVEEAFCRQEVSLESINSDISELLSSTFAGHRGRLFAFLNNIWDHRVAIVKAYVACHTMLDKIDAIFEPHWEAPYNIQSTTTVKDAWLIFIMAACYHMVVVAWLGYFAMHAYALFVKAPISGLKWSSVGLMVASSFLDLMPAYAMERGSSFAKFVVLLIWIFLQGVIGMVVITSQEFKDLVNVLRGD